MTRKEAGPSWAGVSWVCPCTQSCTADIHAFSVANLAPFLSFVII